MGSHEVPAVLVTGSGAAAAAPDVVVIDLGAEARAGHAASAMATAASAMTRMRDAALVAGIDRADLASTRTELSTDYDREGRPSGYRARLGLAVRSSDLPGAGQLLSDLVAAGGDQARLLGTRFEHADVVALQATARADAFAQARAKAEQYAALAGRTLGAVLDVEESTAGAPQPMPLLMGAAAAEAMPVEPGVVSVSASVLVRWELV